jgi:hypothetical protein
MDKETIEQIIKQKIDYISHVMFYIMEIKQEKFGFSWSQINESFCRCLLKIPFDRKIEDNDVLKFQEIILEKRKEYYLLGADPDNLWLNISNECFDFPKEKIPVYAQDRVNALLEGVDSKKRLITGLYGGKTGYIFGEVNTYKVGEHEICVIEKEEVRTPNRVLELVAVVLGEKIYLRRESLQNIFLNNWLSIFDAPQLKIIKLLAREEANVLYHLRKKVLELWEANTKEELLIKKKKFINEMIWLTIYHEIGHKKSREYLSLDEFAIGSALGNVGENAVSALSELLADWSEDGPINYILHKKSSALLGMYIADKWFLEDEHKSLDQQSKMLVGFLADYILSNFSVDFESLSRRRDKVYQLLLKEFRAVVQEVKGILENTSFRTTGRKVNLETISSALKDKFKETDGYLNEETAAFKNSFWFHILSRAPQVEINEFLNMRENFYIKEMADFEKGFKRLKKIGLYQNIPPIPSEEIYKIACYDMGLYKDEAEKVFWEYFKTLAQGGLDVKGAYNYSNLQPCLFFSLLRFMLKKTSVIQPLTALTFGSPLKEKNIVKDREQDLRTRLEKLVEFLAREKLSYILVFRIEKDFLSEERLEQLFIEYDLQVSSLQFVELAHNFIFEVCVDQRTDFLDGVLVNAVKQINQKIRPSDSEKLFFLDKEALKYLGKEYLKA